MVFSSIIFIVFFLPAFLVLYYLAGSRFKNLVILLGSLFFYAWGAPRFLFVILGTTLADFHLVRWMDQATAKRKKILLLCLSLLMNLGLLCYFKYSNFFIANVNLVLARLGMNSIAWVKLVLPIGISFYTFETLTYVIDVYRGVHKPLKNFWDYQLYIILFPKLIAGPIVRFHDIADQVYDRKAYETAEYRLRGLYRFVLGLAKKVIIANALGAYADEVFAMKPEDIATLTAWAGALSYTFQIYFDFSGYSDMAIGLALMLGFRFPENFNNPYTAVSVTDFWRRWHISLGNWMRHYLYIPLGGNRGSKARTYANLWLVFLASGLWHGAAWGFIIWGAYHGVFLVLERAFLGRWLAHIGKWSFLYTFFVVLVGWVFFRLEHLRTAVRYLSRMFHWYGQRDMWMPDTYFIVMTAVAAFFSFVTLTRRGQDWQDKIYFGTYPMKRHYAMSIVSLVLCLFCIMRITTSNFNPFIYFRF
jgi:alginate O-acetyltransferase complex protein AlgI